MAMMVEGALPPATPKSTIVAKYHYIQMSSLEDYVKVTDTELDLQETNDMTGTDYIVLKDLQEAIGNVITLNYR